MSINKPFKIKNGLNAGRLIGETYSTPALRYQAVGTDYADTIGYTGLFNDLKTLTSNSYTNAFSGGDIHYNNDGTIMYSVTYDQGVSPNSAVIYQYSLSIPYDVSTLVLEKTVHFEPLTSNTTSFYCFTISKDGKKLIAGSGNDNVYEFTMSDPWNIDTLSFDAVYAVHLPDAPNAQPPRSIEFDPSGTRVYITFYFATTGYSQIRVINLKTPFTFSDGSDKADTFNVQLDSSDRNYEGFSWNEDGTGFFTVVSTANSGRIRRFFCSTPYDTSDASFDYTVLTTYNGSEVLNAGEAFRSLHVAKDSKITVLTSENRVFSFDMGNTATYDLDMSESSHYELDMKTPNSSLQFNFTNIPEDTNSAITLELTGAVKRYNVDDSTVSRQDVRDNQTFDVDPKNLFTNPDGSKLFEVAIETGAADRIRELIVGDPYNAGTAQYTGVDLVVGSQAPVPQSGVFSTDGYRLYVLCSTTRALYQYNLTTAFDISTGSYANKSFAVGPVQIGVNPAGLRISPDGKMVFVSIGGTSDYISMWRLSTPWELDTVLSTNAVQTLDYSLLNSPMDNVYGLYISDDGLTLYIGGENVGSNSDVIKQYPLRSPWDLSSIDESNPSVAVPSNSGTTGSPNFTFNFDGSKLFVERWQFDARDNQQVIPVWPTNVKWEGGTAPLPPNEGKKSKYVFLAQGKKSPQTFEYTLSNTTTSFWDVAASTDRIGAVEGRDPMISVYQGDTIIFNNTVSATHPMYIKNRFRTVSERNVGNSNQYIYDYVVGNGLSEVVFNTAAVEPGTYFYQCTVHSSMCGWIIVMPNEEKIYGKLISQGITA